MIDRARRNVVVGCLFLLCASAAAQQTENPPKPQPAQPVKPPFSTQPPTFAPPPLAPAFPTITPPAGATAQQNLPVVVSTIPVTLPVPKPAPTAEEPLGKELHDRVRESASHYRDQSASDKRAFDLSQTVERKEFEATLSDKGFWERGRLKRDFREAQRKRRKEFDAEQEKKRRTYEWRYP